MTVAQAWTYQPMCGNTAIYSSAMSDADWQPNGNVLVASGTLIGVREPFGWTQIVEVTAEGQTVFELDVLDSPVGTTFDADRIPDIRSMNVYGSWFQFSIWCAGAWSALYCSSYVKCKPNSTRVDHYDTSH